jgi:IMP dehydrogenase
VGIGPGSICTTRQVTGHGVPQLTAIYQTWKAIQEYGSKTGYYVPIIADGGIRTSGDIVKSLAVGASSVMLGGVFASTYESPGDVIVKNGKSYKPIRGMGSRSAMEERSGSRGRYHRQASEHSAETLTKNQKQKLVPEGVEGLVQLKGSVVPSLSPSLSLPPSLSLSHPLTLSLFSPTLSLSLSLSHPHPLHLPPSLLPSLLSRFRFASTS